METDLILILEDIFINFINGLCDQNNLSCIQRSNLHGYIRNDFLRKKYVKEPIYTGKKVFSYPVSKFIESKLFVLNCKPYSTELILLNGYNYLIDAKTKTVVAKLVNNIKIKLDINDCEICKYDLNLDYIIDL